MNEAIVNKSIHMGCNQLEVVHGFEQLDELIWHPKLEKWVLHFSITETEIDESQLPCYTQWYMLIDPLYPRGSISIFPDKENSIDLTYQHQNHNIETENYPWRWGRVCTDWDNTPLELLSDSEELKTADQRISWHVRRLKKWLIAASKNELVKPGDHFELPHLHYSNETDETIVFAEDRQHLEMWSSVKSKSGYLSLKEVKEFPKTLFVSSFLNAKKDAVQSYNWGDIVDKSSDSSLHFGVWLFLRFEPILKPWSYPTTIGELEAVCKHYKIDLWKEIYDLMHIFRKHDRNYILIGFPIPEIVGQENSIIHWIALKLSQLTKKVEKIKGFRRVNDYYFSRDRLNELNPNKKIKYLRTENWGKEAILSRGSLNKKIQQDKVFLLGAGALGSAVGELLSRTGVSHLTICDEDKIKIGNLSRHMLGLGELTQNKATALSRKLINNNLHIRSSSIISSFPELSDEEIEYLEEHDVVIDTTGSDAVIDYLYSFDWTVPKRFVSISLGYGARRMFILLSNKNPFPQKVFYEFLQPWLSLEKSENQGVVFPREGIGCYHPLFPARLDDIWTMAGLAIKELEAWWPNNLGPSIFAVYEQQKLNGLPAGILVKQREEF